MMLGLVMKGWECMAVDDSPDKEIADLQDRLAKLDRERASVLAALERLTRRPTVEVQPMQTSQMADVVAGPAALSNAEKVALFRSLFRGRDDVFPRRWENAKTRMPQRMGSRHLREAADQVQQLPKPGIRVRFRRGCEKSSAGAGHRQSGKG
jgi:hypothetical protein